MKTLDRTLSCKPMIILIILKFSITQWSYTVIHGNLKVCFLKLQNISNESLINLKVWYLFKSFVQNSQV